MNNNQRNLFGPLGITHRTWKRDARGRTSGHGGLYLSTRDMAKIGLPYLNRGKWDGRQIISADWIEASTTAQVDAGEHYDYGYQWWIRPVAGCHAYRAWGRNGQFIVVVPKLDLVVAVTSQTGLPGGPSGHYAPLFDIVAAAVLDGHCQPTPLLEQVYTSKTGLPPDLQQFLDDFACALASKQIEAVMDYYSHRYLNWGRNKQATARFLRLMLKAVDQFSFSIDQCRVKGDRAHLAGEIETEMGPLSLSVTDLIKEDGHWKWYGNQQTQRIK